MGEKQLRHLYSDELKKIYYIDPEAQVERRNEAAKAGDQQATLSPPQTTV